MAQITGRAGGDFHFAAQLCGVGVALHQQRLDPQQVRQQMVGVDVAQALLAGAPEAVAPSDASRGCVRAKSLLESLDAA